MIKEKCFNPIPWTLYFHKSNKNVIIYRGLCANIKKNICITFRELTLSVFAKTNVVESAKVSNSFKLRTNLSSHVKIVKKNWI